MEIELTLNGERIVLEVPPEMPLLWVLRDRLRLTGTKFGCGIAQCGACTVHVDGNARRACVTPVASVAGAQVRTIEGLEGPSAEAVQSAWVALDVPQCGYCQSGQVMSAVALLESNPAPSDAQIEAAMVGNLCRCNCYVRIRQAVRDASDVTRGAS
jgi:isoquinoline 1-oxidoreductase alpha subunit